MLKKTFAIATAFLLSGFFSTDLAQAASVQNSGHNSGKIGFIIGDVRIGNPGHFEKAAIGQTVREGQTVKTGSSSIAILTLNEHANVKLLANSSMTLSELNPDEIVLLSGGIFSDVEKQKRKHFFIRTRSVVMGVRGTQFFTSYGKTGKAGEDVWMCVNEGVVAVEPVRADNSAGDHSDAPVSEVLVREGLGVLVPAGGKITEPKPYAWTKGLNWNMDPKQGDVVDKNDLGKAYKELLRQNYD